MLLARAKIPIFTNSDSPLKSYKNSNQELQLAFYVNVKPILPRQKIGLILVTGKRPIMQ